MERKICKRCGNWFSTKSENTMCQYCIAIVLHSECGQMHDPCYVPPRRKKGETALEKAVKAATEAGMSYGYYMAWKEGRR